MPRDAILGVAVDDQVDATLLLALVRPADGDLHIAETREKGLRSDTQYIYAINLNSLKHHKKVTKKIF